MSANRRVSIAFALVAWLACARPGSAWAAAGDGGDASVAAADGGDAGGAGDAVPLACDGSLCDTTNGSTCSVSRGSIGSGSGDIGAGGVLVVVLALVGAARRRRKQVLFAATLGLTLCRAGIAHAEPPPPVDVVIHDEPAESRLLTIEWNPVALIAISKLSANVVVVPVDHHALVLSPFYSWAKTEPIIVFDDAGMQTQLPEQKFTGFGAELGYRYYTGTGGPRGFFLGPSLILASFSAKAQDGTKTPFMEYGGAADAGYELLLADRVALSFGAGVQYIATSKTIPDQQFPARVHANGGVLPRLLLSIGWAL